MDLKLPPVYLLPAHLSADERRKWEEKIPTLTHDASKADFIVGKSKKRCPGPAVIAWGTNLFLELTDPTTT